MSVKPTIAILMMMASTAAASPAAAPRDGARVPVTVSLEVVQGAPKAGGHLVLRAHVTRHGAWRGPIAVSFQLPSGATLSKGALHHQLAASNAAGEDTRELELAIGAVPAGDVVVIAESKLPGGGFHAEARYRFGRVAAAPTAPRTDGPHLRTPRGDLGASVSLTR